MVNSEKPSWREVFICTLIGLLCQAGAMWSIIDPTFGGGEPDEAWRYLNILFFCINLLWYIPLVERMFR